MSNEKLDLLKKLVNALDELINLDAAYKKLDISQAQITIETDIINPAYIERIELCKSEISRKLIEQRVVEIGKEITELENMIKSL